MIDSHCHLDFKNFDTDREEVISRFFHNGGVALVNPGCDLKTSRAAIELAKDYDKIFAGVGVHPHDAKNFKDIDALHHLAQNKKVVAIGEFGLDYYRNLSPKEDQIKIFKLQLELAQKLSLPVIIHCRDAYDDALHILSTFDFRLSTIRGVMHCFSGQWKQAQKFLDLGLHLSFTGAITYPKNDDAEIFEVIRKTPIDKILIETDAPFLTPAPYRGKRNEPSYVKFVAAKIAAIKQISADEVLQKTANNAVRLFRIQELS